MAARPPVDSRLLWRTTASVVALAAILVTTASFPAPSNAAKPSASPSTTPAPTAEPSPSPSASPSESAEPSASPSAAPAATTEPSPSPSAGSKGAGAAPIVVLDDPSPAATTNAQWKTLELSWSGGTTNTEPSGWQNVGFNDASWDAAYIPTDPYPNWVDIAGADWLSSTGRFTGHLTSEIWIARFQFALAQPSGNGTLTWNVDNTATIWINGQQLASGGTWTNVTTTSVPLALLHAGTNAIAIKVVQDANTNNWATNPTMFQASLSVPTSGVIPDEAAPPGMEQQENNGTSPDPVSTFSGDFRYSFADVAIAGRGPTPTFVRSYDSADTRVGLLGPGWTNNYSTRLRAPGDASGDLLFVAPDGNSDRYTHNPDDSFSAPPAVFRTLAHNGDGSYTATEVDRSTWTFDASGNLIVIKDRYGNASSLGHNPQGQLVTVSDPAGRGSLALAYTNGRLTSVSDWSSPVRTVTYEYDGNGRLWKVTNRDGKTTTFGYEGTSHRLTTITDARGDTAVTMTYDAQGRVQTQKDARGLVTGQATMFTYVVNGDGTRITTLTYPPTSFEPTFSPTVADSYNAFGWLTSRVTRPSSTETLTVSVAYAPIGAQASTTDARGNTTDRCYDISYAGTSIAGSRGNLTRVIGPAPTVGGTRPVTLFAYDTHNNTIQTVAPKGVPSGATVTCVTNLSAINTSFATDLVYDATGTSLLSTTTRFTDPDAGAKTATTKFEYGDPANPGRMTRIIPPRGNTGPTPDYTYATTLAYGATGPMAGMTISTTDALGNATTFEYDAVGRRTKLVDPLGNVAGGVPAEHTRETVYDTEDRVRFSKAPAPTPGGAQLVTEFRYDAVGNRTVQVDANNQVTTYAFDERDSLFQVKESPLSWTDPAAPPATIITTEYAHDVAGELTRVTRAKGDALNERVTDYAYDGRGLVRRETQYPSWPATSPSLIGTSTYDPNGNAATVVDPLGQTTTSSYDRLNRLTGIDYSASGTADVAYGYDANGNRTSMADGTGSTAYAYDEADRLTSVTSPGPKTVGYRYDLDGNRSKLIYPDATAVTYTFNKASQLASLLDWANRSVSYGYWPDGALKTATKPDSTVATYAYDNARRATDILHQRGPSTIVHYAYALDSIGNITGQQDGNGLVSRSSVSSPGIQSDGASTTPSISGDGRYVSFASDATNLVAADTNATTDIFIRDLQTGTTTRISVATAGTQANGASTTPSISGDGRYVSFASDATNLVAADTNATTDIFVRDLQTGTTTRISVATAGTQANGASTTPSISGDGRYVSFASDATNLVAADTNATTDIFVRDVLGFSTLRGSVASNGTQGSGPSLDPSISADGLFVAFSSTANFESGGTNVSPEVFVHDFNTGTTSQVSVVSGMQAPLDLIPLYSRAPSISADGRYVAFESTEGLVPGDTNPGSDVFVRDLQTATTYLVSLTDAGAQADSDCINASISADGSLVGFGSAATNLVTNDTNGLSDIFVKGLYTKQASSYGYDRLSRLTSTSGPDGARTYTYDPVGNRATIDSGGTSTYGYDRADRIGSITGPPTPGTSTRAAASNDAGWASGANSYTSDNAYATSAPAKNATTAIKVGTFGFDSSIPANATISNVTVTVEWKVSLTTSIATLGSQAYVSGAAVGTELVNAAEPTSDQSQSFSVSGLTRAQLLNGTFQVRVRATRGNSNTAFTASLDAVSVKVDYAVPAVLSLTVDANGNTTAKGGDTFTYDQPNRLKTATVAGASESYAYDGDGVRFSRQVGVNPAIRYVSDVNAGLPVTLDDGSRKYVWGLGLAYAVSGSSVEIYHTDRLGSVRTITDAAGTVTATYRTDEFGVPTATSGSSTQPFRYTGQGVDSTALVYLRARYYDPSVGRFLGRDPSAGNANSPISLNRFAYVDNNPIRYTDPSGRCVEAMLLALAGPEGVAAGAGITFGCFLVVATVTAIGSVAAGVGIGKVTSPLIDNIRGDPTHQRWAPPERNPDIGRAIDELNESVKSEIHIGQRGTQIPPWCNQHPTVCRTAAVGGVATLAWLWSQNPQTLEGEFKPMVLHGH